MKFTYSSGQRPLDGYTIKRGIGHGGFGEVYYGVSDGGKEVALKLVRSNLEVELRGVAQCLNLKHQNLVNLYDLRTDNEGNHWVVMEYVAGEPLSIVLGRHQQGLAPELAQQWFLELARAVGYLHDHGIVHRDLKPGNIFLENGAIKIGDYGLSKFIAGSQHAAQTQSVGTVHYMAPEIGSGNYNKQIDIYASGILLYEMLTGRVPFEGESATEILLKHLTAQPDLSLLPREHAPIVSKALAKDPAMRYASMAEMARALESIGQPEAKREQIPGKPGPARQIPVMQQRLLIPVMQQRLSKLVSRDPIPDALPADTVGTKVGELCGSMALSAVLAALAALLWAGLGNTREWTDLGSLLFLTVGVTWSVLLPTKFWAPRRKDSWARRVTMLAMGVSVGILSLWVDGAVIHRYSPPEMPALEQSEARTASLAQAVPGDLAEIAKPITYFAVAFFALRWWRMSDPRRSRRFSFAPILATGCWSALLLLIWTQWRAALALVLASAIVQLVSPWDQPPPVVGKRLRLRYV